MTHSRSGYTITGLLVSTALVGVLSALAVGAILAGAPVYVLHAVGRWAGR